MKTRVIDGNMRMGNEDHNRNGEKPKNSLKRLVMFVFCGLYITTIGAQTIGTVKDYFYPNGDTELRMVNDGVFMKGGNEFELYYKI